jgi:hypothetical protein
MKNNLKWERNGTKYQKEIKTKRKTQIN